MKFALFLVLSLSAMAFAGPAFNKNNQISEQQQQQAYQQQAGSDAKSPAIDILKQWCFSSQMSQQELTASFKKLVQVVKSSPIDQTTESAVMSERICQGALVQKSQQTGQTVGQTGADAKAHELIKDVYMDALISCKSRECTEQLLQVISSQQVDTIRASYYMTRIAVSDKQSLKDQQEVKQFAESFIQEQNQQQQLHQSEAVERQKLFATTSLIGKWIQDKPADSEIKEIAKEVAKSIIERYIKPVSQQDVEQYEQAGNNPQQQQQQQQQLAKKIAKRSAALKALANIPGHVLKQAQEVEQILVQLSQDKQELATTRQSAIECLEQNDMQMDLLKQLAFDQQEPIEVRIAAYRALMTAAYQGDEQKNESAKEQMAQQIVDQVVKHCEDQRNQQQDEQFVLYAISHLDNVRTSQQSEYQAVKETIAKNKQHYMQIQVLNKKFKQQLSDVRRSSRNYKLEQEFAQLESGLVLEGDIIYESQQQQQQQQQHSLPKLVRVNMSMPIMGETVNVIEVTLRQNNMDEEIMSVLKLAQNSKFNSESVSKVVDSFKSSVEKQQEKQQQQQQQQQRYTNQQEGPVEADLTIKVDGCTVVYLSVDDVKSATSGNTYYQQQKQQQQHQRNTRSVYSSKSIVDDVIEFLKRQPVNFNRGFNVNINERLAKVLDVDANILAGLRFESRAQGSASQGEFEIVAKMEPRFSFEAVVGPAKVSSKKLLQRVSTKSALGMRLRFKKDELVDVQLDLPMNTMELFTFETQLVEKTTRSSPFSYNYLPESIYGDEDIYSSYPIYSSSEYTQKLAKRSIYQTKKTGGLASWLSGRKSNSGSFSHSYETSDKVARAVGLRGQLRVVASPQDMGLLVSAIVQKYEPQMEGYRVKIEKAARQGDLKQYLITVSTPNSRIERTTQVRVAKQSNQQRTLVKADVQSPKMSFGASVEVVHDSRQYSIKTQVASRDQSRKQWRHALEAGYTSGASANSGRLAQFSYKPYVSIDSTELSRPIQMQGQLAYQQSPKSVISYELKCSTSGNYVQGKIIVDQRDTKSASGSYQMRKRSAMQFRQTRSMQSPLELLLTKDLTFTHEMIAQVEEHAVKVHQMADWDSQKFAIQADSSALYKNSRKQQETRVSTSAKLDADQQVVTAERKSPTDPSKDCSLRVASQVRQNGHQMEVECRHQGRGQSVTAYKHNISAQQVGQNKYEVSMEAELVDTKRQVNEKISGRARVQTERNQKIGQFELTGRNKQAKVNVDYQSLAQHRIQVELQGETYQHKAEVRNNKRQFAYQSRTDNKKTGQIYAKMIVEANKQEEEYKMVLEAPAKRTSVAADLKLASGKRSSIAVQTGRYASSAEFSFDKISRNALATDRYQSIFDRIKPAANLRFRSNLKDLAKKQAYWMDSALISDDSQQGQQQQQQSFLRFDSPYYRTDIEFDPRDQETKLAAFARSKRSTGSYDSIYSTKDSSLYDTFADKLNLGLNKSWMLRSIVSSPYARKQLKEQARRALFEYADRRQAHKHSLQYSPAEQRLTMDLYRQPNTEFVSANEFEPIRAKADFSTSRSRPSTMSLESEFMNYDAEFKPFDDYESYAKVSALSRHRRSPFKKHESEYRYKKDQGYKAWMKHVDSEDEQHSLYAESDASPKKYAKVEYKSDKHGKANWEHKWRNQKSKRAHDNEDVYENKFAMSSEGPAENRWKHETRFQFEEPIRMTGGQRRYRERRSIQPSVFDQIEQYAEQKYGYSPIEYLKHTNARFMSQTSRPNAEQLYKLDFDYKPHQNWARLNLDMPENMLHSSEIELKPSEKLYKLQSKLYNRMTNEPSYEFTASTKPYGLASADQEPVFVDTEHPMYERPISKSSLAYTLFKQPMKLDYSDKWGRKANIDYDESPLTGAQSQAAGLRQKRAAVYYKDNSADFEHSSSYDFYPETYMTNMKPSYYTQKQQKQQQQQQPQTGDVAFKTETKYGPIVVRADSNDYTCQVEVATPVMNAKLAGETGANQRKLYKFKLDNKSQRVQVSKLLREAPASIRDCQLAKKFARKLDSGRFEHQTELLVSMVNEIFKIKSATKFNERPIAVIEGEYDHQQEKAFAKVNGERINGQFMADLARKTADLIVEVDDKHTMHHVARMERTSDKFYSLESMTTYKSRPVLKLIGKVSAQIFEPSHLFARRHYSAKQQQQNRNQHEQQEAHVSTFEAVLYKPQEVHVTGQYDCDQKEARIVFKNVEEKKFQETLVRYDETNETFNIESRLSSADEGTIYATKARLSLPGLSQSEECSEYNNQSASGAELYSKLSTIGPNNCRSEMIYSDKSGSYGAKYQPGEYITVTTPKTKQTINLAGYYYY